MAVGQSNNVVAIVQARMGSSRFIGKTLKKLPEKNGKSILEHIINRVRKSNIINEIIVVTSDHDVDYQIVELCHKIKVKVFRGSEDDVLSRFIKCQDLVSNINCIVRLTADNPFIDFEIIDKCISSHFSVAADYSKSTGLPLGTNIEIINKSTLDIVDQLAKNHIDRENVTSFINSNPKLFAVNYINYNMNSLNLRLTIDYPSDYTFACVLYDKIYRFNENFVLNDVLDYVSKNPSVTEINVNNIQKS